MCVCMCVGGFHVRGGVHVRGCVWVGVGMWVCMCVGRGKENKEKAMPGSTLRQSEKEITSTLLSYITHIQAA